jgi:hemerythrin-like domain-containing protein
LLQAREIRWCLQGHPRGGPLDQVLAAFLEFWENHAIPHLQEEEEVLLPAYQVHVSLEQDEATTRMLEDHIWLHQAVAELQFLIGQGQLDQALFCTVGQRLDDHVRLEERVVFQRIQAELSEDELSQVARRSQAFRRRWQALGSTCLADQSLLRA